MTVEGGAFEAGFISLLRRHSVLSANRYCDALTKLMFANCPIDEERSLRTPNVFVSGGRHGNGSPRRHAQPIPEKALELAKIAVIFHEMVVTSEADFDGAEIEPNRRG
jgi:hypothetical protein